MKSFEILTNNKEIHLQYDPKITFEEMRAEMAKLIECYEKAHKAALRHLNPETHPRFDGLKDPRYKSWHEEKLRLDKEANIAYSNMNLLVRHFCPHIYMV